MHVRLSLLLVLAAGVLAAPGCRAAAKHSHASKKAEAAATAQPKALGQFGAWTAATYQQGGQTICYAFTRAHDVGGATDTSGPLLTVTERPTSRDEVAITNTSAFAKDAQVLLQVGRTGVDMYTSGRDAFARDPKSAVAAFQRGSDAVQRSPDSHGGHDAATYSLDGFSKAYDAIVKACPAH